MSARGEGAIAAGTTDPPVPAARDKTTRGAAAGITGPPCDECRRGITIYRGILGLGPGVSDEKVLEAVLQQYGAPQCRCFRGRVDMTAAARREAVRAALQAADDEVASARQGDPDAPVFMTIFGASLGSYKSGTVQEEGATSGLSSRSNGIPEIMTLRRDGTVEEVSATQRRALRPPREIHRSWSPAMSRIVEEALQKEFAGRDGVRRGWRCRRPDQA
mgnify:CR=1 FL=1